MYDHTIEATTESDACVHLVMFLLQLVVLPTCAAAACGADTTTGCTATRVALAASVTWVCAAVLATCVAETRNLRLVSHAGMEWQNMFGLQRRLLHEQTEGTYMRSQHRVSHNTLCCRTMQSCYCVQELFGLQQSAALQSAAATSCAVSRAPQQLPQRLRQLVGSLGTSEQERLCSHY
jgi:hypothetical protein